MPWSSVCGGGDATMCRQFGAGKEVVVVVVVVVLLCLLLAFLVPPIPCTPLHFTILLEPLQLPLHTASCSCSPSASPSQKGPVRGISIKLQEEERERRDNFVPEVSAIAPGDDGIVVDPQTREMLREMEFGNLPGLSVVNPSAQGSWQNKSKGPRTGPGGNKGGPRGPRPTGPRPPRPAQ